VRPLEWHFGTDPAHPARNWAASRGRSARRGRRALGAVSALRQSRAESSSMKEQTRPYKQDEARIITPATWRWCARTSPKVPIVPASPQAVGRVRGQRPQGALSAHRAAVAVRRQHMPHIEAIRFAARRPAARPLHLARLAEEIKIAVERREQALLFLNRRGYAPLGPVPGLRAPLCLHHLRRLAGRSNRFRQRLVCTIAASRCRARKVCPHFARPSNRWSRSAPASNACRKEAALLFPMRATMVLSSDLITSIENHAQRAERDRAGPRHIIIGTQLVAKGHNFPAAQSGRRWSMPIWA